VAIARIGFVRTIGSALLDLRGRARRKSAGLPECLRRRAGARSAGRICGVCHENGCAQDHDGELCGHDGLLDFDCMPLLPNRSLRVLINLSSQRTTSQIRESASTRIDRGRRIRGLFTLLIYGS
jgi:hypothetical protein